MTVDQLLECLSNTKQMSDIVVYDDIISLEKQIEVERILSGQDFPWYLANTPNHYTSNPDENGVIKYNDERVREYIQFVHVFIIDGVIRSERGFPIVDSLFEELVKKTGMKVQGFFRIKANLQPKIEHSNIDTYNLPHTDADYDHKVAIYYVNDSDGDTAIFDNSDNPVIVKSISPKRGRFVVFDGKHYHAGRHPNSHDTRIVVNFNFI